MPIRRALPLLVGLLTLTGVIGRLAWTQPPTPVGVARADPMVTIQPVSPTDPAGFSPAQIQSSYGLSPSPFAGTGQTIAIVDAFDNPGVAYDLTMFDAYWGLPACGDGCFTKVDQTGGTNYPSVAPLNWSAEIAMDVEWAHAIAPGAQILLVEAQSSDLNDLVAAEQFAGTHAQYVSNSWGLSEFPGETAITADLGQPGVSYFAAVADSVGKTQFPATSPNVIAVGGSALTPSGTIPWASGGGGCSAYERASSAEAALSSQAGCAGNQSTPQVTADAVGIPVFDAGTGWLSTGGTSFATVLWAAAAADSGAIVTPAAISSGSISLHAVVGGTPLQTGIGDLAQIPITGGEIVSIACAEIDAVI